MPPGVPAGAFWYLSPSQYSLSKTALRQAAVHGCAATVAMTIDPCCLASARAFCAMAVDQGAGKLGWHMRMIDDVTTDTPMNMLWQYAACKHTMQPASTCRSGLTSRLHAAGTWYQNMLLAPGAKTSGASADNRGDTTPEQTQGIQQLMSCQAG